MESWVWARIEAQTHPQPKSTPKNVAVLVASIAIITEYCLSSKIDASHHTQNGATDVRKIPRELSFPTTHNSRSLTHVRTIQTATRRSPFFHTPETQNPKADSY